ncbi:MAG: M56 family metallopeptidase [Eubacteriales bacterium]
MNTTAIALLYTLLALALVFSAGGGSLLLLRRAPGRMPPGRTRVFWIAVLLLSVFPLRVFEPVASLTVAENHAEQSVTISLSDRSAQQADGEPAADSGVPRLSDAEESLVAQERMMPDVTLRLPSRQARWIRAALALLACVWLIGAAAFFLVRLSERISACRALRAASQPCTDGRLLDAYRQCAAQLGVRCPPPLRLLGRGVHLSPCFCGILHPCVYVSELQLSAPDDVLRMILTHELSHVRAGDQWLSLLASAAASLHWMHPLAGRVERAIAEDCEFSCDANVLRVCGEEQRALYIHAILDIAAGVSAQAARSGGLYAVKEPGLDSLMRRYNSMRTRGSGRLCTALSLFLTAALFAGNAAAMSSCAFPAAAADVQPAEFQSDVLAHALAEYFGLADASELTQWHLSRITSIEVLSAGNAGSGEPVRDSEGNTLYYPVRIRFNGGLLWDGGNFVSVVHPLSGDANEPGYCVDTLPMMLDPERYEIMRQAIYENTELGAWNESKFTSFYTYKDATPASVQTYAVPKLLRELVPQEQRKETPLSDCRLELDETGRARVLFQSRIIAEMDADVYEQKMAAYRAAYTAEICAKFPFADKRPMYVLDPLLKPREREELLSILDEAGLLEGRVLVEPVIDLSDTARMPNLTSLTVDGAFTPLSLPESVPKT